MGRLVDVALTQDSAGVFDIDIDGADLLADSGMRTAVAVSLFSDRIAEPDDVIPDGTDNRRGYWADAWAADGDKFGSRLWLLGREMQTTAVLTRAEEYTREALQWLLDDGAASAVNATASWADNGLLCIETLITRSNNTLYQDTFNVSLEAL